MVDFQPCTLNTPYLGSVAYCYIVYLLDSPHPLLLPSNVLHPQPSPSVLVLHEITCRPGRHLYLFYNSQNLFLSFPHLSLPKPDPPSPPWYPPRLPDYRCRHSHAAAEISFNITFSCCSVAACCYHGSQHLPYSSYLVSFAHTSKIGLRDTHYATVACLFLM